jgi:Family of unknown function (DUF5681)
MPFPKGVSGNPAGRKPGSVNRPKGARSLDKARARLMDSAEAIVDKMVDEALGGDIACLTMAFGRLIPMRKDLPQRLSFDKVENANDAEAAAASVVRLMLSGRASPSDASAALTAIRAFADVSTAREIHRRLQALEKGRGTLDLKALTKGVDGVEHGSD